MSMAMRMVNPRRSPSPPVGAAPYRRAMATAVSHDRPTVALDLYGPVGRSPWMDIDWRTVQRWVRVSGRWMNVIDLGPGPDAGPAVGTIVWIHGLSGSWQNWLEQLPVFAAAGWRCVAMDLPGFGASEMPADQITISRYAAWIDELLGELGVTRAMGVGNSMGGFIGPGLALQFSTSVENLVLRSVAGLSIEYMRNEPLLRALLLSQYVLALGA